MVPFAVAGGGALGKEARRLFFTCRDRCSNKLLPADDGAASWSSRGGSNFFFQKLPQRAGALSPEGCMQLRATWRAGVGYGNGVRNCRVGLHFSIECQDRAALINA